MRRAKARFRGGDLRKLRFAAMTSEMMVSTKLTVEQIVHSDPEIMGGEPVYKGTRIPVVMIADMLAAGDTIESIREG